MIFRIFVQTRCHLWVCYILRGYLGSRQNSSKIVWELRWNKELHFKAVFLLSKNYNTMAHQPVQISRPAESRCVHVNWDGLHREAVGDELLLRLQHVDLPLTKIMSRRCESDQDKESASIARWKTVRGRSELLLLAPCESNKNQIWKTLRAENNMQFHMTYWAGKKKRLVSHLYWGDAQGVLHKEFIWLIDQLIIKYEPGRVF